jgi:hypothetical protein
VLQAAQIRAMLERLPEVEVPIPISLDTFYQTVLGSPGTSTRDAGVPQVTHGVRRTRVEAVADGSGDAWAVPQERLLLGLGPPASVAAPPGRPALSGDPHAR